MPQRRCLLTGQRAEAETLLRFAVVEGPAVVPDPAHRFPGRGLWLAPAPDAVATGASLVPVMVTVIPAVVTLPAPSSTVTVNTSVRVSPTSSACTLLAVWFSV